MVEVHIIEDTTLVKIAPKSHYSGKIRVNGGTPFSPYTKTIVSSPVTSIEKVITRQVLSHYIGTDESVLSPEEYQKTLAKLREGAEYCEDSYSWLFLTLPQKKEHDEFLGKYAKIVKDETTYEPVEWETYHYASSDNDFITPLRMLGKLSPLYQYITSWTRLYSTIADKYGFTYVDESMDESKKEWSTASHSKDTAQYNKIGGKYVKNYRKQRQISAGTYAECEAAYKSDYELVEVEFKTALARVEGKQPTNVGDLLDKSRVLLNRIDEIAYMQKGYGDWKIAKKHCNELIKLLENQL